MKTFIQYLTERKVLFKFDKNDYDTINQLYRTEDDDKIIEWIEKNIKNKKGLSAEDLYNEFKQQKN